MRSNFIKNYGQSMLSLSFNLFGILAGTILVVYFDVLSLAKWASFDNILQLRERQMKIAIAKVLFEDI
jgi:hypothetical protein